MYYLIFSESKLPTSHPPPPNLADAYDSDVFVSRQPHFGFSGLSVWSSCVSLEFREVFV